MFSKTWRSFVLVAGETVLLATAVVISSMLVAAVPAQMTTLFTSVIPPPWP